MDRAQVFVGRIAALAMAPTVASAIVKEAMHAPLWLGGTGLAGDLQADSQHHGGPDRALHHYPAEHYRWWRERYPGAAARFQPGTFGENLSLAGWREDAVHIGDVFRWGDALLQLSQPRSPCFKLDRHLGLPGLARLMQQEARCGWLYRVLQPGQVGPGADFALERRGDGPSVQEAMRIMYGGAAAPESWRLLLAAEGLAASWRRTLEKRLAGGGIESWNKRLDGPEALSSAA